MSPMSLEGSAMVDIGGDVARNCHFPRVTAITPKVGGIGPLTVTSALHNLVHAWKENVFNECR